MIPPVSGAHSFGVAGVTKLELVDWPRRIGIDNLVVDTECAVTVCRPPQEQEVPEPPTLPILAFALGLLALVVRNGRRVPRPRARQSRKGLRRIGARAPHRRTLRRR